MRELLSRVEPLSQRNWFSPLILFSFCFFTIVVPILIGGMHVTGDLTVMLGFAQNIRAALADHNLLPGWGNDPLGFGNIGIRLYPPLAPYLLAIFEMLIGSWYLSVAIFLFFWTLVGSWGVNLFVRESGTRLQGLAAGLLYMIVPFPLAEIFQYSYIAEFAAGAVGAFCFLFVTRLCKCGKWIDVILLAAAIALLVLTHIPATILTVISLLVYTPFLIGRVAIVRTVSRLAIAFVLGLLSSSFYWIKLTTEVQWVAHFSDVYSAGVFGYRSWSFPMSLTHWNDPVWNTSYPNMDEIIGLTLLLLLPALILIMTHRERATHLRVLIAVIVSSLVGFFMLSQPSGFIWSTFSLLQKIQFPYRWLTPLSFLGTFAFVLATASLLQGAARRRTLIILVLIGFLGATIAYDVRRSYMKDNRVHMDDFARIVSGERENPLVGRFHAWRPVWADENIIEARGPANAATRDVVISSWQNEDRTLTVAQGEPTTLRIGTFYYPYWQASINGVPAAVAQGNDGTIAIPLTNARSDVHLYFQETSINRACLTVSIITWLGMFFGFILIKFRSS